ncbi:MAG: PilZ domain-containing protein [Terracidiphilus sp.]
MSSTRKWFRLPFVHRPRAERRESPALAAVYWDGSNPRQSFVANISASGAYLYTNELWNPGDILSLTLQRSGVLETVSHRRFTVQAKVIRRDREGAGVAFLMPRGADLRLWQSDVKADVPQTEPEDVVREFRLAAAIAFIDRVAPDATDQARLLMRNGLSNFRLESATEIALHAEELLALENDSAPLRAEPTVVLRILEDGSWAETDWIQHYWAGVLATACAADEFPQRDLKSVSLLSQITTIQARIFAGSCTLAVKSVDKDGRLSVRSLTCSSEKLVQIADTHDRVHIERDIQHLVELGLIERSVKWNSFSLLDLAAITPTQLALELYARCHGHRRDAGAFYAPYSEAGRGRPSQIKPGLEVDQQTGYRGR